MLAEIRAVTLVERIKSPINNMAFIFLDFRGPALRRVTLYYWELIHTYSSGFLGFVEFIMIDIKIMM